MDGTKATILIAEDSRFLRKATELILLKAGFSVITAEDGLETLQIARSLKPDLIVLDLMMPRLNGVEVIKELKQDGTTAKIPLVVLSVLSQQNEAKLMKVGAAAYYEKTKLVPEALVGIIQKVLHESRGETSNCAVQAIGPTEEADRDTLLTSNRNHREYEQQLFEQLISLNNELLAAQRELARTNEELKRIAATDELTGLANRRKATEDIQKLLALAQRHNQQIALAFLDLDNFKPINDRFGHASGDMLLRSVGNLLVKSFRTEDVVSRWGGDEFVVALYGCGLQEATARLTQVGSDLAAQQVAIEDNIVPQITCSMGIACFPASGRDLHRLCHAADTALYQAKSQGRNRIVCDEPKIEPTSPRILRPKVG